MLDIESMLIGFSNYQDVKSVHISFFMLPLASSSFLKFFRHYISGERI